MRDEPICQCGVSLKQHNIMEDGHQFSQYIEAQAPSTGSDAPHSGGPACVPKAQTLPTSTEEKEQS